jgi:hypothetical protein
MENKTKRYRIKAQDDLIRIDAMTEKDQYIIIHSTLKDFIYFSYDPITGMNKVVNALNHNKIPFTRAQMIKAFMKREEPIFKYLMTIDNKDLYTEINRDNDSVDPNRKVQYGLGLKRFEFHHVSDNKEFTEPYIKYLSDTTDIFFFKGGVEGLIQAILEKLNERL